MKLKKAMKAKAEAERFLAAIDAAIAVVRQNFNTDDVFEARCKSENDDIAYGTKEAGALHRASLDLSRALAELRKP